MFELGAKPALAGTPGMIGYGMAKAAVHQLVKSLAAKKSGLPEGTFCAGRESCSSLKYLDQLKSLILLILT
jgi:hypothetical protein